MSAVSSPPDELGQSSHQRRPEAHAHSYRCAGRYAFRDPRRISEPVEIAGRLRRCLLVSEQSSPYLHCLRSPESPPGTCNIMDPEVRAHVNESVMPNHTVLHVIIAVLGASILGYACVLTYSFRDDAMMDLNDDEMRQYNASPSGGASG
ncbi:hypothetical protein HPB50_017414 [Hyalomma asiaticum]|uniref:Uncharacterized protein n=1 Tax=Hyalomma asiaticum TaxID=266040 RepID=A0ACB7S694_HYAAI|nr:hypothetical protein HPB50_017414 [Hyalomma asiaticum]